MENSMSKRELLVTGVIILTMHVIGTFLFINSSFAQVERSAVVLNDSFTVPANDYQISEPISFPKGSDGLYSFTVSEGTIKFFPLDIYFYKYWEEDRDKLLPMLTIGWVEGDDVNYRVWSHDGSPYWEGGCEIRCVFFNEDSYDKEVQMQITVTWYETNYLGMIGGIAIVVMGPVLGMTVKTKKLL
jgi:hypothetical protein